MDSNTFHIYLKEDFFNIGDVLMTGNSNVKVIRKYNKTWWRILFRFIGFNVKINSEDIKIYKVKLLKYGN